MWSGEAVPSCSRAQCQPAKFVASSVIVRSDDMRAAIAGPAPAWLSCERETTGGMRRVKGWCEVVGPDVRLRHRMARRRRRSPRPGLVGFGPDRQNARAAQTTSCRCRRLRRACPTTAIRAGIRKWLGERGVVYGLEYTNDVLANVHGGLRRGTIDQGKLQGILTIDLRQARRLERPDVLRQLLPDPQHRPHPARLCRRPQHHRRDRGGPDHAAFGDLARAEASPAARRASRPASSRRTPSSSSASSAPCSCRATGRPSRR